MQKTHDELEQRIEKRTQDLVKANASLQMEIAERKRVQQTLVVRNRELSTLSTAITAINAKLTLKDVLQTIAEQVVDVLESNACSLSFWKPDENLIETVIDYNKGYPEEIEPAGTLYVLDEYPMTRQVLEEGETVLIQLSDPSADPAEKELLELYDAYSVLMLPLMVQERVFGLVALIDDNDGRLFTPEEIRLAESLTAYASVAIDNARLYDQAQYEIQERERAEQKLHRLNLELEQRISARTVEFETKARELETFAYSVAHDLKAPLRGIDGYSQLLLQDYSGDLSEEAQTFLMNIRLGTRQMTQLINDLLDYARLERRSLTKERLYIPGIIKAVVAERSDELKEQEVDLVVEIPYEYVIAEAEGLSQALRNLLDNALKFTYVVPSPAIEIGGQEKDDAYLIWVKDNGIGFEMQYHDRIFEVFQRLHRAEDYPGTGIGLALVRKVMQRIGGKVWARSVPSQGAIFYLEIPK